MRYLILFMILAGLFVFGGQSFCGKDGFTFGFGGVKGKGPAKTETRSVSDFQAVDAQIHGVIELRVAEQYSVEVQAQENLLPIIKTEVKNGVLRIYFEKNVWSSEDLVVRISAPAYEALSLSGSGHMEVFSPLNGENLKLSIAGSGEILLPEANVKSLACSIAGSGNIQVNGGRSDNAEYKIAGSGDIQAKNLTAEHGTALISGSGEVSCHANQTLKATVSGSGDIFYKGSPSVDTEISGSGKVKKVE